jgi:hypothetical protein
MTTAVDHARAAATAELEELRRRAVTGLDSITYLEVLEAVRRELDRLETAVFDGPPSTLESAAVVEALRALSST